MMSDFFSKIKKAVDEVSSSDLTKKIKDQGQSVFDLLNQGKSVDSQAKNWQNPAEDKPSVWKVAGLGALVGSIIGRSSGKGTVSTSLKSALLAAVAYKMYLAWTKSNSESKTAGEQDGQYADGYSSSGYSASGQSSSRQSTGGPSYDSYGSASGRTGDHAFSQSSGHGSQGSEHDPFAAYNDVRREQAPYGQAPYGQADSISNRQNIQNGLLILEAMIFAARADGTIDKQEQQIIRMTAQNILPASQVDSFIRECLHKPLDPWSIAAKVTQSAQREDIYRLSAVAIVVDTHAESNYLADLAQALKLDRATQGRLEAEARNLTREIEVSQG